MVGDQHQVAHTPIGAHAARHVGHDQRRRAERLHHADGKRELRRLVSLVGVQPALHDHEPPAAEPAEQ